MFFQVLRNTIAISAIKLTLGMFFAILLALVLNEVRNLRFKKITQTISYLPYFISWVVAANLVRDLLATDGIINEYYMALNIVDKPIIVLGVPELFLVGIRVFPCLETNWLGCYCLPGRYDFYKPEPI